ALEGLRGGSNQAKLGSAWVVPQERMQCVAATAEPKRREPMAAGARQYEKRRLLPTKRLSSFEGMNFLYNAEVVQW
ncbi:hypothetical protein B1691_16935, partial [Geobacillus sp. 47C-IIb]|uniref:hypothetical protein n=1 Tax=Geobacillus sp. 47C-IIb TaxID=1963026 RepID=UPI0009F027B6